MTIEEQQILKRDSYNEALRYMANAKENLKKAGKHDRFFQDEKYVKSACGIAYSAVLLSLDAYFKLKDIQPPKNRASKEYYEENLSKLNKKLLSYFNNSYKTLHLSGYYDGNTSVAVINAGLDIAYEIIEKIKP